MTGVVIVIGMRSVLHVRSQYHRDSTPVGVADVSYSTHGVL
jgi:hypothetical protein